MKTLLSTVKFSGLGSCNRDGIYDPHGSQHYFFDQISVGIMHLMSALEMEVNVHVNDTLGVFPCMYRKSGTDLIEINHNCTLNRTVWHCRDDP